jgi:methionine sulfoxide reductase heme-binding subunit
MTTWLILRAAGVAAYVAFFLSVAWGLLSSTSLITKRISKPTSTAFHATVASAGLAFLAIHMAFLFVDRFVPFGLSDLFMPLKSAYRPVPVAFGIVAMYGMVIVLVSSWVRKRLGTVWWRRLHLLAVPMFTLTLLHGLFAGSDSARPWMFAMYVVTGLITLFLVIVRGLTVGYRPTRDVKERVERARPVAASAPRPEDGNVPPEPARTAPLP